MSKSFEAVIFDLDGVITKTALVHSLAWKKMFDGYLKGRAQKEQKPFEEFTHNNDYLPYVDGKPRYKGVASFLLSRGIKLDYGHVDDTLEKETVCGLGNRKNQAFTDVLQKDGVQVYASTVKLIKQLLQKGIKVGVASSSKNCQVVLEAAGLSHLFETRVDGVVSVELKLQGKPEPDIFTTACDNLGITYDRAVIVEDAVSGVQAGKKGNFGLVIGIAREDNEEVLKAQGADLVVKDLNEVSLARIEQWFTKDLEKQNWHINYYDYDVHKERTREALLTVGNGYMGVRGAVEESRANEVNYPATYIAGIYNRLESRVADKLISNEDFVNTPNWAFLTFRIAQDEWVDINKAQILRWQRTLNMKNGVLARKIVVKDKKGRETLVESWRIASMAKPHLAALKYNVTPLNYTDKITVKTVLDGDIINAGVNRYKQLKSKHLDFVNAGGEDTDSFLVVETNQSKIKIANQAKILIFKDDQEVDVDIQHKVKSCKVESEFSLNMEQGHTLRIEKLVSIYTSKDKVDDPLKAAVDDLKTIKDFKDILQASENCWADIWKKIDVKVEGDRWAQVLLRLHLYHLMVAASPNNINLDVGITARGLHGEAYRGRVFWDDLYILPLYAMHFPKVAKSILMYRYRRLDKAREYARQNGYKGAMFPWQSGSDGREETPTVHLNPVSGKWGSDFSCYQRHVSLSVAYNIWQYYGFTKDGAFLQDFGAEMIFEISRFWVDKASYDAQIDKYHIAGVMGPDEYHEKYEDSKEGGVRDNAYTNIMVVWLLRKARQVWEVLNQDEAAKLAKKLNLTEIELAHWQDVSRKMNLCLNEQGILEQFDGYFALKELDWEAYSQQYGNIHRMDRILKAEGKSADDYKVAKQADTLMTFYNLDVEEVRAIIQDLGYKVPKDFLRLNFDYYLRRTSHGSTLSRVVHAYLSNVMGNQELSWQLYQEALFSDYTDIQGGTTGEGIHTGVMAGTVLQVIFAYAGVFLQKDRVEIKPNLPKSWKEVSFNFDFQGVNYAVTVFKDKIDLEINSPKLNSVVVMINDKAYSFKNRKKQRVLLNETVLVK